MPLEAWYRFLADPFPYSNLERVQCPGSASTAANCVQPATNANAQILLDEPLLAQRAAFLRPDSRLGVVMLTDENDCSLAVGAQSWAVLAIDDPRPFFRGSGACDQDPNDPNSVACDCFEGDRDRALCESEPGVSEAGPLQFWGKAYPGTRQLEVLRGIGERATVASICARNTSDVEASDFSYRPAIAAWVDSMAATLSPP